MLYDLTHISGARLAKVDQVHVGGRQWIAWGDIWVSLAGLATGTLAALPFMAFVRSPLPLLALAPTGLAASLLLLKRTGGSETERGTRRLERIIQRRTAPDGVFILPGPDGESPPDTYSILIQYSHPL